ncbi:MAG: glycosyltransferase family 2 protein [Firmicutes bacterium]|nr:glycosyltransferase family 2 protein [Bacillota bacterium]
MDFSVVVPVYGCRAALPELHRRLTETLRKITDKYEIILVNDNCPQNSWEEIERICAADGHVVGVELSRNFGQIKAITAGLDVSKGEWVCVMDCDLQDRPEEILPLYKKALEGYDVVFARRKIRKENPVKVFVSNCFYKVYSAASGVKYDPALCNFSVSRRKVIDSYCSLRESHRAFVMYIQWLGFRMTSIDVEQDERFAGESGYNFKKRLALAIEILTSQSDKLIKATVMFGILMAFLAFLGILITLVRYFVLHISPGYSSIIVTLLFTSGLTVTTIGVVGIYVGNIFVEVKHRPLYVIRTLVGKERDNE